MLVYHRVINLATKQKNLGCHGNRARKKPCKWRFENAKLDFGRGYPIFVAIPTKMPINNSGHPPILHFFSASQWEFCPWNCCHYRWDWNHEITKQKNLTFLQVLSFQHKKMFGLHTARWKNTRYMIHAGAIKILTKPQPSSLHLKCCTTLNPDAQLSFQLSLPGTISTLKKLELNGV